MEEKNDDDNNESSSSDENEDSLEDENGSEDSHSSDLLYKAKNGTKYKKKVSKIIRYVRYSKKKDLDNYCREQLMLFIPWQQKDLLASFDTFEAHYNSLKTSIESKSNEYEHHTEELELARQMIQDEENPFDQIHQNRTRK